MWKFVQTMILVGTIMLSLGELRGFATENQRLQTVTLQIDGMTCGACVKEVKAALANVSGVSSVEVTIGKKWLVFFDYADARAAVTFDPDKASVAALIEAVERARTPLSAYKARVLKE